jgi:hypothetical protein
MLGFLSKPTRCRTLVTRTTRRIYNQSFVTTHLSVSQPKALILLVNDDSHFLCIAKKEGNRRRNWPFLAIIEVLDATVSQQYQGF